MRKRCLNSGFSIVEMLVALFFTMVLMAGMAAIFKSSISVFTTSADSISSTRRNRLAMDLLSDDLNFAGLYATLAEPAAIVDANPGFIVNPNVAFTGTDIPAADAKSDELLFYYDDLLPVQGQFKGAVATAASYVASEGAVPAGGQEAFKVVFKSTEEANLIKQGMMVLPRGFFEPRTIVATPTVAGSEVTLTVNEPFSKRHLDSESVLIAKPAQYVRYSIQSRNWDPENPSSNGIPCLIREQGPYPGTGTFSPDGTLTTIVAENVSKFTVSLSADHGATWASGANWSAIKTSLNTKLASNGAPGYTSVSNSAHWYRYVPILMRVNVTTRTAVKRGEYSSLGNQSAYKEQTQTLMLTPRHFGLSL